jgi:hypothetical protein
MEFAEVLVPDPIIISLKKGEESLDNIQRYYVKCAGPQEKYNAVTNIYGTLDVGQAIIFCDVSIRYCQVGQLVTIFFIDKAYRQLACSKDVKRRPRRLCFDR